MNKLSISFSDFIRFTQYNSCDLCVTVTWKQTWLLHFITHSIICVPTSMNFKQNLAIKALIWFINLHITDIKQKEIAINAWTTVFGTKGTCLKPLYTFSSIASASHQENLHIFCNLLILICQMFHVQIRVLYFLWLNKLECGQMWETSWVSILFRGSVKKTKCPACNSDAQHRL